LKIRFFAPETRLASIHYGDTVQVSCDGCARDITAKVTFIASSAEYTPPVIYSRDERAKLVYLIEARTADPDKLRVGQPVTVTLSEGQSQ
jgi:HlyD family secretion protein